MLPDIDAEYRDKTPALHEGVVLVCARGDLKFSVLVRREPCPAGAELTDRQCRELFLQCLNGTEMLLDGSRKLAFRRAVLIRAHNLEIEVVVIVAAAVVSKRLAARLVLHLVEGRENLLRGAPLKAGSLNRRIEVLGVGRVVLGVVGLHGQGVDVRLQCREAVAEFHLLKHSELLSLCPLLGIILVITTISHLRRLASKSPLIHWEFIF